MKENLTLDEVVKLGGDKSDFNLLTTKSTKFDNTNDLKKEEFVEFYKKLGFKPPKAPKTEKKKFKQKSGKKNKSEKDEFEKNADEEIVKKKGEKKKKKETKLKTGIQVKLETKSELDSKTVLKKVETTILQNEKATKSEISKFDKIIKMAEVSENLPKKTLIQENQGAWFSSPVLSRSEEVKNISLSMEKRKAIKTYADKLLDNEIDCYKNYKRRGNSEWMKTVVSSGTISDKIAAYTLLLDGSAIHNIPCLLSLLNLVKKKGTRETLLGIDKFGELLIANVLPENRRIQYFHQQPFRELLKLTEKSNTSELLVKLIYWAAEDRFKSIYSQFISRLSEMLQEINDTLKVRAMRSALLLLSSRPEQEDVLLKMLVNKFGDPKYKIASKALHMLHSLVNTHPAMQGVVAREVRDLLLRPNIHERCQYYCICFLSTLILSNEQSEVADFLIEIFLAFYKAFSTKKRTNDKILSALLTGVNRSYPFASTSNEKIVNEMDSLYKTVHLSSISTAVQSLMLLFQLLSSRNALNDRYYNALYGILLSAKLPETITKHAMFLNLVFRSMKADELDNRCFSFVKRILQSCALHAVPYTSASLVLVCEVFANSKSAATLFNKTSKVKNEEASSDDEDEHYVDVDEDGKQVEKTSNVKSSWTHHQLEADKDDSVGEYNALNRVPLYANADKCGLWELHTIHRHYHPTVVLFAENVVKSANGQHQPNESDPLMDFTLMKFLDKFVYRNPKAVKEESKSGQNTFGRRNKARFASKDVAANSTEFLSKKIVRPEEIFLHRYFKNRADSAVVINAKQEDVSDVESVSDEEFERYLNTKAGQMNLMEGIKVKTIKDDDVQESTDDEEEEVQMSDLDDEEVQFDLEDEDPFADAGAFMDADEDINEMPEVKPTKSSKVRKSRKKTSMNADDFGSMLEETASQALNLGGSHTMVGSDKVTAKQMKWEKKQEERDIIRRKRAFKRGGEKKNNFKNSKKKKRF